MSSHTCSPCNCIVQLGLAQNTNQLPWEVWVAFPGESQLRQSPNLWCMLRVFIIHYRILNNMRADVNVCDCTWECTDSDTLRQSAQKFDSGKKSFVATGIKPVSAACQSHTLPPELRPRQNYQTDDGSTVPCQNYHRFSFCLCVCFEKLYYLHTPANFRLPQQRYCQTHSNSYDLPLLQDTILTESFLSQNSSRVAQRGCSSTLTGLFPVQTAAHPAILKVRFCRSVSHSCLCFHITSVLYFTKHQPSGIGATVAECMAQL